MVSHDMTKLQSIFKDIADFDFLKDNELISLCGCALSSCQNNVFFLFFYIPPREDFTFFYRANRYSIPIPHTYLTVKASFVPNVNDSRYDTISFQLIGLSQSIHKYESLKKDPIFIDHPFTHSLGLSTHIYHCVGYSLRCFFPFNLLDKQQMSKTLKSNLDLFFSLDSQDTYYNSVFYRPIFSYFLLNNNLKESKLTYKEYINSISPPTYSYLNPNSYNTCKQFPLLYKSFLKWLSNNPNIYSDPDFIDFISNNSIPSFAVSQFIISDLNQTFAFQKKKPFFLAHKISFTYDNPLSVFFKIDKRFKEPNLKLRSDFSVLTHTYYL